MTINADPIQEMTGPGLFYIKNFIFVIRLKM